MTQVPPAPAQGIAVAPVTLVASTLVSVPLPPTGGGGPMPWRTPWMVVLNSSPFTLLVSSGAQVTQIAAFTSDKVYVQAVGLAPTLLPVPGAQTLVAGVQDSTAYVTWYQAEPPGTYPAALGSGAALFAQSAALLPVQGTGVIANFGSVTFLGNTGTSIGGFGGMTMIVTTTLGGPLSLTVSWLDGTGANVIAHRDFTIGALNVSFLSVSLPHKGPFVKVVIVNNSGGNASANIGIMSMQQGRQEYILGGSVLITPTTTACPPATTTVVGIVNGTFQYGGPAMMSVDLSSLPSWQVALQRQNSAGLWADFANWATGGLPHNGANVPVLVPPDPLRIRVSNNGLTAANCTAALLADDYRTA